ncbi:unnamed protein product [Ceratitis capitata]|uniref:(Mediterranean fruit fly) hypothetical protein n=1 Tax=Ceratitis capitata TaxID=7213 RepID=A0A811ULD3_CERCA|nr:unnamed protein product [Ceratitis capitata]
MVYTERTDRYIAPKDQTNNNAATGKASDGTNKYSTQRSSSSSSSTSNSSWESKKSTSEDKWKYNNMASSSCCVPNGRVSLQRPISNDSVTVTPDERRPHTALHVHIHMCIHTYGLKQVTWPNKCISADTVSSTQHPAPSIH